GADEVAEPHTVAGRLDSRDRYVALHGDDPQYAELLEVPPEVLARVRVLVLTLLADDVEAFAHGRAVLGAVVQVHHVRGRVPVLLRLLLAADDPELGRNRSVGDEPSAVEVGPV